jgi:hypothetical protein
MSKVAIVVLADTETHEGLGRVVNALEAVAVVGPNVIRSSRNGDEVGRSGMGGWSCLTEPWRSSSHQTSFASSAMTPVRSS